MVTTPGLDLLRLSSRELMAAPSLLKKRQHRMNNPQRQRLSSNPEALPPESGSTRLRDWTFKSDPEFPRTVPSDDIHCGTLLNMLLDRLVKILYDVP